MSGRREGPQEHPAPPGSLGTLLLPDLSEELPTTHFLWGSIPTHTSPHTPASLGPVWLLSGALLPTGQVCKLWEEVFHGLFLELM